ncbi:hypothetical protein, partial [Neisseria sp. HMSC074B07]|uniref:hypothetical protein n=1 Tax=Neisseria sp. HMSC074B07 TaxID=1715205 RepID=UPI001AEF949B
AEFPSFRPLSKNKPDISSLSLCGIKMGIEAFALQNHTAKLPAASRTVSESIPYKMRSVSYRPYDGHSNNI